MLDDSEQVTLDLILALKENELAASRFYAACATEYGKHRAQWQFLQTQEEGHLLILTQVETDFRARPHRWKRGKILVETIRYIVEEVKKKTSLVAAHTVNEAHAVTFSIDFESSLVEKELLSSITTSDLEFENRLAKVRAETENHRNRLRELDREVRK